MAASKAAHSRSSELTPPKLPWNSLHPWEYERPFADGLDEIVDCVGGFAVLVDEVEVRPPFRGAAIGLRATAVTLKELPRGCSFAALIPMAPGLSDDAERAAAAADLTRYWARLGFRPWRDGTMVLPFALVDFDNAAASFDVRPSS